MENIIKKLVDSGIRIKNQSNEGEKLKFLNKDYYFDIDDEYKVFYIKNYYLDNEGFIYAKYDNNEYVLLKGFYKDFIRRIKEEQKIEEKIFSSISALVSDIERLIPGRYEMLLLIDKWNDTYLGALERGDNKKIETDTRQDKILNCYSKVEYSLEVQDCYNSSTLYSNGFFKSIFPETLSPLFSSILNQVHNIINPLFMSANIKTHSPSVKVIMNRLYINITNIESIITTLGSNIDYLLLFTAPYMIKNIEKLKIQNLKMQIMDIKDDEITENISDIEILINELSDEDIFGEKLIELLALITMNYVMLFLKQTNEFITINQQTGSVEASLKLIHCTRRVDKGKQKIQKYIDPIYEKNCDYEPYIEGFKSYKDKFKEIPAGKRLLINKVKLEESISKYHMYRNYIEDSLMKTSEGIEKIREIILRYADKLIDEGFLLNRDDIFYITIDEMKDFISGKTGGLKPYPIQFKKWKYYRCKAQIISPEILEKDVEEIPAITDRLVNSFKNKKEHKVFSMNHKENKSVMPDEILLLGCHGNFDLELMKNKKAVIGESINMFGRVAEYCYKNNIPMYSGLRLAPIIFKNKTIELNKDKLVIKDE